MSFVKIVTFVPVESADDIRRALGQAGAGVIGKYTFCSYSAIGVGRFLPGDGTHPHIGSVGELEAVQEERIEVVTERNNAKLIVEALKQVHPYEEVAVDIYPLLSEEEL